MIKTFWFSLFPFFHNSVFSNGTAESRLQDTNNYGSWSFVLTPSADDISVVTFVLEMCLVVSEATRVGILFSKFIDYALIVHLF